jgi:hypothetical protein
MRSIAACSSRVSREGASLAAAAQLLGSPAVFGFKGDFELSAGLAVRGFEIGPQFIRHYPAVIIDSADFFHVGSQGSLVCYICNTQTFQRPYFLSFSSLFNLLS